MVKTYLATTIFIASTIFSPLCLARIEVGPERASMRNLFVETSHIMAEPMSVVWHDELKQKTQDLFDKFSDITEIEDATNLEYRMNFAVRDFTKTMNEWSILVAKHVYGSMNFRVKQHKNYCRDVLATLAKDLPFSSQKVEQQFFTTFYSELNKSQDALKKVLAPLEEKAAKAGKRIAFTEGVAATTIAMVAAVVTNQLTGDWRAADIGGFMGFLATIFVLKNQWLPQIPRSLVTGHMVSSFNNDIQCDKILETEKPKRGS
jgi:hypothetical protein